MALCTRALHGRAPERDALRQLVRHGVRHQLGVELGPLDLFDVDAHFLAGELGPARRAACPLPPRACRSPRPGGPVCTVTVTFPGLRSMWMSAMAAWESLVFRYLRIRSSFLQELGEVVARA